MLTFDILFNILQCFKNEKEIGCIYNIAKTYNSSLTSLELLGIVSKIQSKVPACSEHCSKVLNCSYISQFEDRKTRSKYRPTRFGEELINELTKNQQLNQLKLILRNELVKNQVVDVILSNLINIEKIPLERVINILLIETNLNINTIRISLKDILSLLESLLLIRIENGYIMHSKKEK